MEDAKKECFRDYYRQNREKFLEKKKEKNICSICGGKFTSGHKSQHETTMKHNQAIELSEMFRQVLSKTKKGSFFFGASRNRGGDICSTR